MLGDNRRWRDDAISTRLGSAHLSSLTAVTGDTTVYERVSVLESRWAARASARTTALEGSAVTAYGLVRPREGAGKSDSDSDSSDSDVNTASV